MGRKAKYTEQDFLTRLDRFVKTCSQDKVFANASTLLYETSHGRLIGACLGCMADGVPALGYLGVHPQYRRRGLATRMIQKALTALHGQHSLLKVQVFVGNAAESLYHSLGFQAGMMRHTLCIPAGTF